MGRPGYRGGTDPGPGLCLQASRADPGVECPVIFGGVGCGFATTSLEQSWGSSAVRREDATAGAPRRVQGVGLDRDSLACAAWSFSGTHLALEGQRGFGSHRRRLAADRDLVGRVPRSESGRPPQGDPPMQTPTDVPGPSDPRLRNPDEAWKRKNMVLDPDLLRPGGDGAHHRHHRRQARPPEAVQLPLRDAGGDGRRHRRPAVLLRVPGEGRPRARLQPGSREVPDGRVIQPGPRPHLLHELGAADQQLHVLHRGAVLREDPGTQHAHGPRPVPPRQLARRRRDRPTRPLRGDARPRRPPGDPAHRDGEDRGERHLAHLRQGHIRQLLHQRGRHHLDAGAGAPRQDRRATDGGDDLRVHGVRACHRERRPVRDGAPLRPRRREPAARR